MWTFVSRYAVGILAAGLLVLSASASDGRGPASALPMLLDDRSQLEELRQARAMMMELRLQEAENRLVVLDRRGADAAAMHHLGVVSLMKGLLTDEEENFTDFFERSDELKRILKDEPNSVWREFLHAENELNRALAHAKLGQTWRAAMAGRSAYGAFEALQKAHPGFPETYKGLGMLKLSIGTLSGGYRKVLGLLGYSGSVADGIALLRRAYEESEFGREEAGIYLALLIAQVERSSEEPVRLLAELHRERPSSPLLSFLHGYMLLHHRHAEEAEQVLRPLVRETGERRIEYARFYLAQALFVQDRFEESIPHFRTYLEEHEGRSLRAQATLGLGLALEMSGNRDEAVKRYRRVDDSRGHETDLAAGREARQRLEQPIEGNARTLLLARNAFDSGRSEVAVILLSPLLRDQGTTAAERAEAAYRLGRACQAMGRDEEALAWYAQGAVNSEFIEGRWAPWGHFYRAEILAKRGNPNRARSEYERAVSFGHEYDFKTALHSSVRAALELIQS